MKNLIFSFVSWFIEPLGYVVVSKEYVEYTAKANLTVFEVLSFGSAPISINNEFFVITKEKIEQTKKDNNVIKVDFHT